MVEPVVAYRTAAVLGEVDALVALLLERGGHADGSGSDGLSPYQMAMPGKLGRLELDA